MKKDLLKLIKKWLAHPGNSKVELAFKLGYRSSSTINNWLARGRVPEHMQAHVERIVK